MRQHETQPGTTRDKAWNLTKQYIELQKIGYRTARDNTEQQVTRHGTARCETLDNMRQNLESARHGNQRQRIEQQEARHGPEENTWDSKSPNLGHPRQRIIAREHTGQQESKSGTPATACYSKS